MREGKGIALLPIGVFLVLYLGLGILFEYVMEIPMGFYNANRHRISCGDSDGLSAESSVEF